MPLYMSRDQKRVCGVFLAISSLLLLKPVLSFSLNLRLTFSQVGWKPASLRGPPVSSSSELGLQGGEMSSLFHGFSDLNDLHYLYNN